MLLAASPQLEASGAQERRLRQRCAVTQRRVGWRAAKSERGGSTSSPAMGSLGRFSDGFSRSVASRAEIGAYGGGTLSREQQRERRALSGDNLRFYPAAMGL